MNIQEVQQRTDAWHQLRVGKVTASRVADIIFGGDKHVLADICKIAYLNIRFITIRRQKIRIIFQPSDVGELRAVMLPNIQLLPIN